jgi:hypothetical protein
MVAILPAQGSRVGHHRSFAAPRNGLREIETFETAIEGTAAETEHLCRRLLIAAGSHQRALNVIALDGSQEVSLSDVTQ